MTIKVIDDIIPVFLQDEILDAVQDYKFPWRFAQSNIYNNDSNRGQSFLDNQTIDSFQFYRLFLHTQHGFHDPAYEQFRPMVHLIQSAFDLQSTNVLRVKSNMLTNNNKFYPGAYNPAHVDGEYGHWVIVYYVNDSDGDTVIFNETYGADIKTLTVKDRISPKKGRAVAFPGKYFHASSNPIKSAWRCVFNLNLSPSKPIVL